MAELVKQVFHINLLVLQILGFYPTKKCRRLYKLYSFIVYCIFSALLPILCSLYLITDPNITFEIITDNLFLTCQLGCCAAKMIPLLINDQEVRKNIYMMENPIFLKNTKNQEVLIEDCINMCRHTSWLFLSCCSVCVTVWSLVPFLDNGRKLPIDIWLPPSLAENSNMHYMSFVYVVVGTGHAAISHGALDPMLATMVYVIITQIKILKYNLEHLSEYAEKHNNGFEKDERKRIHNQIIYNQIKHCVDHHNTIVEYVATYENTFSPVVFIQFSASIFVICVSAFKLGQVSLTSVSLIWTTAFLITVLIQIFLYCYFGTLLFEENDTLIQTAYMGKWDEYDLKSQKALITLMERSQRPMVVTAGKILDLSLNTFTTILKRAYSLVAVLKNY